MKPNLLHRLTAAIVLACVILGAAACDASGRLTYPVENPRTFSSRPLETAVEPSATVALALPVTPTPAPSPTPLLTPTPARLSALALTIPAPALAGNLLGDADEQMVQVLLPPSYETSALRYPVVYFLPGFGGEPGVEPDYYALEQVAGLMAGGELQEMILVTPNGANALGGSFYVNSPVTGNWDDFIVKDLVGYIDENFRTIRAPEGRAVGGHSMGGFAAFNLAMRHPGLFSAAYLLAPGLLGEKGLADFHVLQPEKRVQNFLEIYQNLIDSDEATALKKMTSYDGPNALSLAYGTAFAPNPELGAPYFDYPYRSEGDQLVVDPDAWARWEDGMGNLPEKVAQNRESLLSLRGIVIDYARQDRLDWIPRGSEYLAQLLTEAGIPNQLYSFDGDHADQIPERLATVMLPFFSDVLAGPTPP